MLVKPEIDRHAKIKVVGIGGGGGNALNSMIELQKIQGVEFVAVNTDAQALEASPAPNKLQIGEDLTRGLGSGGDPDIGRAAAEESEEKIRDYLQGSDMIFLTAGLGGGTGTGASPIIADIAKSLEALTIGVVTKPFKFEGQIREKNAEIGADELRDKVDALITIPNQKLLEVVEEDVSLLEAFRLADSVLGQGVQGISDLVVMPGLINVDFADVRSIMTEAGSALMGIGTAGGDDRAVKAARAAISSPLLEVSIDGARGILFNIVGGKDLGMSEIEDAAQIISEAADPDANIIFGAGFDEELGDQIKITVIATGFDAQVQQLAREARKGIDQAKQFERKQHEDDQPSPSHEEEDPFEIPAFLRQRRSAGSESSETEE